MSENPDHQENPSTARRYLRFVVIILVSMAVMYVTMFAGTWEWSHVRFSESRVFMTMTMGGTMALVMLVGMSRMYRNVRANIAVATGAVLLIGAGSSSIARRPRSMTSLTWMP